MLVIMHLALLLKRCDGIDNRKVESPPTQPENFELPFEGKLSQDNRWVIMTNLVPWD